MFDLRSWQQYQYTQADDHHLKAAYLPLPAQQSASLRFLAMGLDLA
mgnify:CR=1 FL=1